MTGRTWEYKGEVDAVSVAHIWRVIAIVVVTNTAVIGTGVVVPHDRAVRWSWILAGVALVVVLVAGLGLLAGRTLRQGARATPPPAVAFGIALGFLVALSPIVAGLSGPVGIYRVVLFGPALVVSAFGTRSMVALFTAITLVALAGVSHLQDVPPDAIPALVLAYGIGWGGVIGLMHLNHASTVTDLDHQKRLAQLSGVVATAPTLDQGLRALAPVLAELLDADALEIRRTRRSGEGDPSVVDTEVVAQWAAESTVATEVLPPVSDRAGADDVVVDGHSIVFVATTEPGRTDDVVVRVARRPVRFEARMTVRDRVDEARAALRTLQGRVAELDRLETRSTTDSLTELANRRALFARLMHERAVAERDGGALVVAMLDVDHFKDFNDQQGHLAGDRVLVELARLLERRLRATDLAARFGGEEFCLVLAGTTAAEAERIVDELRTACRRIPAPRPITFSGGVAEWAPGESVDELLARADRALYAAKAAGRDRTVVAPLDLRDPEARAADRPPFRTV